MIPTAGGISSRRVPPTKKHLKFIARLPDLFMNDGDATSKQQQNNNNNNNNNKNGHQSTNQPKKKKRRRRRRRRLGSKIKAARGALYRHISSGL